MGLDFGKSPRSESYGRAGARSPKAPGVPDPVQVDQIDPNEPPQSYFPRAGQGRGYLGRRGGGRGLAPFNKIIYVLSMHVPSMYLRTGDYM